jgi:ABC-type transport system involved in multi-copper enzyme maturation permease subunit
MWTLGLTLVIGLGVSAIASAETRSHWLSSTPQSHIGFNPTGTSLAGVFVAQLIIGVLGVMVLSAEYGTGTIRATFSAAPRRSLVLAAKATVFGAVALVVAEVTSFLSFFLGQALLSSPAVHATLSTPGALREVAGTGIFLCVIGLFALGLATLIRHTAGAISAFVAILLVIPNVLRALPTSMYDSVVKYFPSHIGSAILSIGPGRHDSFSPWVGLLVMAIYTLVLLVVGGAVMVRRDA